MTEARLCPCVYNGPIPKNPVCGEKPDDFDE